MFFFLSYKFFSTAAYKLLVKKGKILVLHVQHEFPCISLSYSTKQREITIQILSLHTKMNHLFAVFYFKTVRSFVRSHPVSG